MITLTEDAKKRLDDYLWQVRACLRGCSTIDADEIEQNIIDHIDNELAGAAEPVALDDLDPVLEKLGSPAQWVPENEKSDSARLTRSRVLTYISFALTAAFVLMSMPHTLAVLLWRPILETLIVFPGNLLLPSFILARVALAGVWSPILRPAKMARLPSLDPCLHLNIMAHASSAGHHHFSLLASALHILSNGTPGR